MSAESRCTETETGALLTAYELGLLVEPERTRFEGHLAECEACQDSLYEMAPYISALHDNPADAAARFAEGQTALPAEAGAGWLRRIAQVVWPAGGWPQAWRVLAPVAVAAVAVVVLLQGRGPDLASLVQIEPVPYVQMQTRAAGPDDAEVLFRRGMAQYIEEHYEEASHLLASAVRLIPAGAAVLQGTHPDQIAFYAGLSFLLSDRPDSARIFLEQSLESPLRVLQDRSRWYLAQVSLLEGDAEAARAHLEVLAAESPGYGEKAVWQLEGMGVRD